MRSVDFSDILHIRKGGPGHTGGAGDANIVSLSTLAEWEQRAAALRELFNFTLGDAPYNGDLRLDVEITGQTDRGDHLHRTLSYNTGPCERINADLLIPKTTTGPTPAVLCLHQTVEMGRRQIIGQDPTPDGQDLAIALHLVKRGFVTFAYDLLGAGERCCPGREAFDTECFYNQFPNWSARGKDMYDVARALDVMRTMPEIDPDRIGSIGHSQGGGNTILAMAVEPRIKVGVSSCNVWPWRMSRNPYTEARTEWWIGRPRLRPFCLTGKPIPVDLHEIMALAAPRPLMNINALNDRGYSLDDSGVNRAAFENMTENIRRIYRLYGREEAFVNVTHLNGHGFQEPQRSVAYAFLEKHL